jgi:hypothetical protein
MPPFDLTPTSSLRILAAARARRFAAEAKGGLTVRAAAYVVGIQPSGGAIAGGIRMLTEYRRCGAAVALTSREPWGQLIGSQPAL